MIKGLFVLRDSVFETVYGPAERADISKMVDIYAPQQSSESVNENPSILKDADVIFTSWGAPRLDEEFLSYAVNLKIVFHAAGSVKNIVTEVSWDRGIMISSAYGANATAVAEYTFSQILFCLKRGYYHARKYKQDGEKIEKLPVAGTYGSTAGLISLGMVGRRVCELLKNTDINVIAYDPYVDKAQARSLGVTLCDLEDIFANSDAVSLHTPLLDNTKGMITGAHFESMKDGASFINTARGAVVREKEMIQVLKRRQDIQAVLDVTDPEPPASDSPLYTMENVVLTPHIAGAMGSECLRMGKAVTEECQRYIDHQPLKWSITRAQIDKLA